MTASALTVIRDFAWSSWSALGVSSWSLPGTLPVIDPEALIVVTALLEDERLYLESIDWGIATAQLLMPSRLRRLAAGVERIERVDQWIGTVAVHAKGISWKRWEAETLEGFERSGKSRSYLTSGPAAASAVAIRHREIAGMSVRSEVVRAMHPVVRGALPSLSSSEVARAAGAAQNQSNAVLAELVHAGVLHVSGSQRQRRFAPRIDQSDAWACSQWEPWRSVAYAPWHIAPRIVSTVASIERHLTGEASRLNIVAALEAFDAGRPFVEEHLRDVAAITSTGDAADVATALRGWTGDVARSLVRTLTIGRPNQAS